MPILPCQQPQFAGPTLSDRTPSAAQKRIRELLDSSFILLEDWERLGSQRQQELLGCPSDQELLALLVKHGLLTGYQASRIAAGDTFGLVLGNYRVLDRLGAGGMGVVFKGEHLRLRRVVAIKVLSSSADLDVRQRLRFLREMRIIAQLQHPNIVSAIDDGEVHGTGSDRPLRYFVMEYVPGQDLGEMVLANGPLPVVQACGLVYQVANALAEAHQRWTDRQIGKAGLPDHILGKAGHLDSEERLLMQTHTVLGAETLRKVGERSGCAVAFVQMAMDVARHHHERWDGNGYPDQLAGTAIPLSARIVAIADVYDGLRCRRAYKPALGHAAALAVMRLESLGQFDPVLLQAFQLCAARFDQVFKEIPG
jgi:hypothetical protein